MVTLGTQDFSVPCRSPAHLSPVQSVMCKRAVGISPMSVEKMCPSDPPRDDEYGVHQSKMIRPRPRSSASGSSKPTIDLERWLTPSTVAFLVRLRNKKDLSDSLLGCFLRHWSTPGNGIVRPHASPSSVSLLSASRISAASFLRAKRLLNGGGDIRAAASYLLNGAFLMEVADESASLEGMRKLLYGKYGGHECMQLELNRVLPNFALAAVAMREGAALMRKYLSVVTPKAELLLCEAASVIDDKQQVDSISQSSPSSDGGGGDQEAASRASESGCEGWDYTSDVKLVIVDDETGEETELCVPRDASLKQYLQSYAEGRGAGSLSKIQFAVKDEETGARRTLFMSEVGRTSIGKLGCREISSAGRFVIVAKRPIQSSSKAVAKNHLADPSPGTSRAAGRRQGKRSQKAKKKKKKGCSSAPKNEESEERMLERWKVEHSRQLSELFEEVEPKFKKIRTTLNNAGLKRRSPKASRRPPTEATAAAAAPSFCDTVGNFADGCVGGKAGVSRYVVRVGEVAHLYKTSKPSVARRAAGGWSSNPSSSSIDLHGLTRDEALAALDERLPGWIDDANARSSLWVTTVEIITGGGNQILSEAVRWWIRRNDRVARAPATAY